MQKLMIIVEEESIIELFKEKDKKYRMLVRKFYEDSFVRNMLSYIISLYH